MGVDSKSPQEEAHLSGRCERHTVVLRQKTGLQKGHVEDESTPSHTKTSLHSCKVEIRMLRDKEMLRTVTAQSVPEIVMATYWLLFLLAVLLLMQKPAHLLYKKLRQKTIRDHPFRNDPG